MGNTRNAEDTGSAVRRVQLRMRRELTLVDRGRLVYAMLWLSPVFTLIITGTTAAGWLQLGRRRFGDSGRILDPSNPGDRTLIVTILVIGIASALLLVMFAALTVRRITVAPNGDLTFHRAAGAKQVPPKDITRISLGVLMFRSHTFVRHHGGLLLVLQPLNGFHELVNLVKTANPDVDLSGV